MNGRGLTVTCVHLTLKNLQLKYRFKVMFDEPRGCRIQTLCRYAEKMKTVQTGEGTFCLMTQDVVLLLIS